MGRIATAVVLLLLLCQASPGQNSRVMYFLDLPQARFHNPAFRPSDSLYIGIPVITGVGFSINNNFIGLSDIIMEGRKDSLITFLHPDYDKERFLSKLRKHNSIDADMIVQLLGFGIPLGKGYLFIDLNERAGMTSSLPRDLLLIAIRGNAEFAGNILICLRLTLVSTITMRPVSVTPARSSLVSGAVSGQRSFLVSPHQVSITGTWELQYFLIFRTRLFRILF
jgi:hypothetical protein